MASRLMPTDLSAWRRVGVTGATARPDVIEQRRRDEERGIGPDHDAPEHRNAEAAQHLASKEQQRQHGERGRADGEDGSRERLVEALVDERTEIHGLVLA